MADTTETITIPEGPQGPAGPVGPEGPQGPSGPGLAPLTLEWLEARITALEAWSQIPVQHIPAQPES